MPGYPGYPWGIGYSSSVDTPPPPSGVTVYPPEPPTGRLRLDVEPAGQWQLFVDGVFIGTPGDLGNEVDLRPGTRRIELRAPGYRSLVFDARIEAERRITYSGALEPEAAAAPVPPPVAPTGSRTMFVIPGCYMGNVSPTESMLPPGCDLSRLTTFTP